MIQIPSRFRPFQQTEPRHVAGHGAVETNLYRPIMLTDNAQGRQMYPEKESIAQSPAHIPDRPDHLAESLARTAKADVTGPSVPSIEAGRIPCVAEAIAAVVTAQAWT